MSDAFAASVTVRATGWALLQFLWQGALVGVVTACALKALERSTASRRYAAACLGLAALVVLPVVTGVLHARDLQAGALRQGTAAPVVIRVGDWSMSAADSASTGVSAGRPAMRSRGPLSDERLEAWSLTAVSVWLIGVLALSARLAAGWLLVERVRRAAAMPAPEEWRARAAVMARALRMTRPVRLVESAVVSVPIVIGWLWPVILLPASALTGLSAMQLEAIIAHELAHIRRHDYLVNLCQTVIETLLFYHPATWWISRQIRVEREHCCDDVAVELCGDRLSYARALADLDEMRGADVTLAVAATGGPLLRRVRRLLGGSPTAHDRSPIWAVVCTVLTVVSLLVMHEDVKSAQVLGDDGGIRGQVVDARTGIPLSGATLDVSSDGPVAIVSTDTDGRYEARGLKPGEYRLYARARGYVAGDYGQLRGSVDGTKVQVREGQITSRVDIRLEPAGIISGRILDDSGDGLPGVEIEVLAKRFSPGGNAVPAPVAFAQTEASGVFRVGELQEGEDYVRAYVAPTVRPSKGDGTQVYAPTYFPQAAWIDQAQPVLVAAGQELFDVNFTLATVKKRVVSGILIDPAGLPVDGARVFIMRAGGSSAFRQIAAVSSNGSFEIRDVVPGDYMLNVEHPVDPARWRSVFRQITVDDDVSVELVARRGARLEGRLVSENGDPLAFDPRTVELGFEQRVEGPPGMGDMIHVLGMKVVERDGAFAVDSPAGSSWVKVSNLPAGWTVKAIRMEGSDVTDQATDFGDGVRRQVEIVLTDRISGVIGLVTDRNNRIVLNHTVVIFPEKTSRWNAPTRFVRSVRPRQDGSFQIDDLPPADYLAVAVESLPRNAWSDPAVLERLWPLATRFRLLEGERRTVQLKLSPTPGGLLD